MQLIWLSIESWIQYLEAIDEQSTEFEQIEHFPRSGEQHERKCDRSTVLRWMHRAICRCIASSYNW